MNTIKVFVITNFKENLWGYDDIENKKKWIYDKEAINPKSKDQNGLSIVASFKKKINITKIRTNSHEIRRETKRWTRPTTP